MKVEKTKRGQFVIIAVMLVAIMIVSIGAVMHNAATYYKNEPWEEYATLVSNIELNSQRLLKLSLNEGNFSRNFKEWQSDLVVLYPGQCRRYRKCNRHHLPPSGRKMMAFVGGPGATTFGPLEVEPDPAGWAGSRW